MQKRVSRKNRKIGHKYRKVALSKEKRIARKKMKKYVMEGFSR
ncbi:MAG: hypothetical protein QXL16_02535 [Candidatus Micrarchaeaceae archaeon]